MADEKPKPGESLPVDQNEAAHAAEERDSTAAFNKPDAVIQNEVLTNGQHPGVPSILKNLAEVYPKKDNEPEVKLSDTDLVNEMANHLMLTTSDVVLHEKLKQALKQRGFAVEALPSK